MPISISIIREIPHRLGDPTQTYFDRSKATRLYNRYLDELELAASCGFDGVSVNEHHQNAYG